MTTTDLLTIPEAAACLHVSPRTLQRWLANGLIPTVRPGRRVLITRATVDAYLTATARSATTGPLAGRRA